MYKYKKLIQVNPYIKLVQINAYIFGWTNKSLVTRTTICDAITSATHTNRYRPTIFVIEGVGWKID